MAKFKLYGTRTQEETPVEKENRLLAREAAAEGFVLLENDGMLPLQAKAVALYGNGARLTVKGGTGSGDVHERYSVNIEDGLKNQGLRIAHPTWLDRFTTTYEKDKQAFHDMVENEIKDYPVWKVIEMFRRIGEFQMAYPIGDEIRPEDLTEETDTCIYVIARQAGEGFDRKREKGDYLLSDLEVKNLTLCRAHYAKLCVVINTGSSLDLSPLEAIKPNALLFYGQAGEEGGNALGEVLTGKVSPSGKLTDTWALRYEDYPTAKIVHPEPLEENYEEGIYVGYRCFDAKQIQPLYPFGHGLTYSCFEEKLLSAAIQNSQVTLTVSVRNIGRAVAKHVVFSFLHKPNVKYDGEIKALTAFVKTSLLSPGQKETVLLSFDLADFAVYDEAKSAFVLEQGDYGVSIAQDALHETMAAVVRVNEDSLIEQCRPCTTKPSFEDWVLHRNTEPVSYKGLPVLHATFTTVIHDYHYRLPAVSSTVKGYLDRLTDKELALFAMGGGYDTKQYIRVLGACGHTTSQLVNKGIPDIIFSDGPAGINIMQKSAYTKGGSIRYLDELPKEWQWGWLKSFFPKLKFLYAGKKETRCYQYCTAIPSATMLAQTFNTALLEKVGEGVGKEMLTMGITLWLAPALNIHRDPLCGRNFEYFSEDPLVSGAMAAAITRGVQKNGGIGVTLKHFACNNRENERTKVSSNLSERALREIYLKGFRLACKESPMALMSSYNRINSVYSPNNRKLLIDVLRCEWGYEGLVMSDWDAVDQCSYTEAVKSGNNMIMPGTKKIYCQLMEALKDGRLTREEISRSALYTLKTVFEAKTTKDFLR